MSTRHIFHASCRKWDVQLCIKTAASFSYFRHLFSWHCCVMLGSNTVSMTLGVKPILGGELCFIILTWLFTVLLFSCSQNFLFKCMGVVLNKISNKDFVHTHLNIMFGSVKHSSQVEREVRNVSLPLSFTIEMLQFIVSLFLLVMFLLFCLMLLLGLCNRYWIFCWDQSWSSTTKTGAGFQEWDD